MNLVMTASFVLLWLIVAVQAIVLIECLRQIGLLKMRLGEEPGALIDPEALPRGTVAPAFDSVDTRTGERMTDAILRGRRLLMLFLGPSNSCRSLAAGLGRFAAAYREVNIIAVCAGRPTACVHLCANSHCPSRSS